MNKVKAFSGNGKGGFVLKEIELKPLKEFEVLVSIKAFGINRVDVLQAKGMYLPPKGQSSVLGLEFSGEVIACGEKCSKVVVGQRVAGLCASGAYAEAIEVNENLLIPIPNEMSYEDAAVIPEAWCTSYFNMFMLNTLNKGDRVLIHSAAGGVGLAAIQLSRNFELEVLASVGSSDKVKYLNDNGFENVFNYKSGGYVSLLEQYENTVSLALDTIGPSLFQFHIDILKSEGKIQNIGLLGGVKGELDMGVFLKKNLKLSSSTLRGQSLEIKSKICSKLSEIVIPAFEKGSFKSNIFEVLGVSDLDRAFKLMTSNQIIGKIAISWL